jgi:hypothetical protein
MENSTDDATDLLVIFGLTGLTGAWPPPSLFSLIVEQLGAAKLLRVDHFLGMEPVNELEYLRFAHLALAESWDRRSVSCMQITRHRGSAMASMASIRVSGW